MAEVKTKMTNASVKDFLAQIADEQKRKDAMTLLKIHQRATGEKAKMWGTSIVGFGVYHYKSERSSQEADWMLAAFSPRKQNLTVYIMGVYNKDKSAQTPEYANLLNKLGKYKLSGGACLYIKKLADVDLKVLEQIIKKSYLGMKKKYT